MRIDSKIMHMKKTNKKTKSKALVIPSEWKARPVDIKSGWKNNSKFLSDLVSKINEETFIEDESTMMEIMNHALEILKPQLSRFFLEEIKEAYEEGWKSGSIQPEYLDKRINDYLKSKYKI